MADEKVISIATGRRSGGRKGMRVSVTRGACSLEFRLLPQTEPPPELPPGAGRQEGSSNVVPIRLGERVAERGKGSDIDAANQTLRLNAESGEASQRVGTVEDGSDAGSGGKRKPRAEGRSRRQNKTELVLSMLRSPGGATLKAIMKATGGRPTVSGAGSAARFQKAWVSSSNPSHETANEFMRCAMAIRDPPDTLWLMSSGPWP